VAIILAVISAFVVGGWYLWKRTGELSALDPQTFCPRSGPVSEFAVLIDRTDGLTEVQAEALRRRILAWANAVPKHGSLKVYEVGRGGALLDPIVSVCNPGDGSDLSSVDANPRMWREKYEEKFRDPVDRMVKAMTGDVEMPSSPIMEAVQAISVRDFGSDAPEGRKDLMIVSDLLQHVADFSLYDGIPHFEAFRKSAFARSVWAGLGSVHVGIHLLNRKSATDKQTDALGEFWILWLEEQGAIVEEFRKVPG
jgi:hypothetical protein